MPYGISYSRYFSVATLAFLSMCAGAQVVHVIYRPLDDLDDLIEAAIKERLAEQDRN